MLKNHLCTYPCWNRIKKLLVMKVVSILNRLKSSISILFFAACATFVAIRGYKCLVKYLSKPQADHISYRFNSRVTFPSISFCPKEKEKIEELTKCKLSRDDYFKFGEWVGQSLDSNCTDPKVLYQNVMPKLEDLNIEWIEFTTYKRQIHFNLSSGIDEIAFRFEIAREILLSG